MFIHCIYKYITAKVITSHNHFFLYLIKLSLYKKYFRYKLLILMRSIFYVMNKFSFMMSHILGKL
jgi:hypothetical protein